MSVEAINPDGLYSPKAVSKLENISLALVYVRMARGEYETYKDGRKTPAHGSRDPGPAPREADACSVQRTEAAVLPISHD